MFMTGVLCTVFGAQVYFLTLTNSLGCTCTMLPCGKVSKSHSSCGFSGFLHTGISHKLTRQKRGGGGFSLRSISPILLRQLL